VRFLALCGVAYLVTLVLIPVMGPIARATIAVVGWVANLVGLHARVESSRILSFGDGAFRYVMSNECTALPIALLFVAAVCAYPASARQRLRGLMVGIPFLLGLNVLRLVTLGWAGLHVPRWYEVLHAFWWQAFLIMVLGLGWYLWVRFTIQGTPASPTCAEAFKAGCVFLSVVVALALAGMHLGVIDAYGKAILTLGSDLLGNFWGVRIAARGKSWFTLFHFGYATTISVLALFLATPRATWKRRLRAAVVLAIPMMFLIELVSFVVRFRVKTMTTAGQSDWILPFNATVVALLTLRIVIPVAAWFAWARRDVLRRAAKGRAS
jgi:exosortase/archaeosortase family protein